MFALCSCRYIPAEHVHVGSWRQSWTIKDVIKLLSLPLILSPSKRFSFFVQTAAVTRVKRREAALSFCCSFFKWNNSGRSFSVLFSSSHHSDNLALTCQDTGIVLPNIIWLFWRDDRRLGWAPLLKVVSHISVPTASWPRIRHSWKLAFS